MDSISWRELRIFHSRAVCRLVSIGLTTVMSKKWSWFRSESLTDMLGVGPVALAIRMRHPAPARRTAWTQGGILAAERCVLRGLVPKTRSRKREKATIAILTAIWADAEQHEELLPKPAPGEPDIGRMACGTSKCHSESRSIKYPSIHRRAFRCPHR